MKRPNSHKDSRVEFIALWAACHELLGGKFPVAVDVLRDDLTEYFGGGVDSDALLAAWQLALKVARLGCGASESTLLRSDDVSVLSTRTIQRRWGTQKKLEILGVIHQFRGDSAVQDSLQQPTPAIRPAGPRKLFDRVSGELMWSLTQSAKYRT